MKTRMSFYLLHVNLPAVLLTFIASVNLLWAQNQPVKNSYQLAPGELKAFEGYYQFDQNANAYLQVAAKDNGLVAKQMWDGKEFFVVPIGPLEFAGQNEEYPAKFHQGSDGKITHAVIFGRDKWKRVDHYTPKKFITLSPEKLRAFAGRYTFQFEPGKDSFIQITAHDDHLELTEAWSGDKVKFRALSELEFYSQERAFPLKFTKDNSGTVTTALAFNRDLWTRVK